MYAVIEDSGQQFRVAEGDVLNVDIRELDDDARQVEFDRVLLVSDDSDIKVGTPLVQGAKVTADILDPQFKGTKVQSFYWRRRKSSKKKTGHRQKYLKVKVTGIQL
ncbi:MAG: 50S ribosomal protein L21 [Planctomycetota bacterium]